MGLSFSKQHTKHLLEWMPRSSAMFRASNQMYHCFITFVLVDQVPEVHAGIQFVMLMGVGEGRGPLCGPILGRILSGVGPRGC